jgi:DNA/RNA endonuclease G (NUC1)
MERMDAGDFSNAGVAEAAADSLFVSLADLDWDYGGRVGGSNGLYDENGDLIRKHGAVFNAPLHFIGFGQGAVVNTEIIQRLGTYFPEAGGVQDSGVRDLHKTAVEPFEYNPETVPQFRDTLARMLDPEIVVWDNVTYADNYYQVQGKEGEGSDTVLTGKALEKIPNMPGAPGKPDRADINYELENWAGFDRAKGEDNAHRAAVAWYGGTANLNESQIPAGEQKVFRRLGDLLTEELNDPQKSWYVPGHTKSSFNHGDTKAPWEGIGTGWFYSVNGGGSKLRPYFVEGESKPKSKDELGDFEKYLENNRRPVTYDNTYTDDDKIGKRMRGDYGVPTLFNGNFDVVAPGTESKAPIPGWSVVEYSADGSRSSTSSVKSEHRVNWKDIDSLTTPINPRTPNSSYLELICVNLSDPNYRNYATELDKGFPKITKDPFLMPDWGVLSFNLHVPPITDKSLQGSLQVTLRATEDVNTTYTFAINLARAQGDRNTYQSDTRLLDYATAGFETFTENIPDAFRGKETTVTFELQNPGDATKVYLDDATVKSVHLKFGNNPKGEQEARADARPDASNPFKENLLIERPQYALSYNGTTKTANWASWQMNKSWNFAVPQVGGIQRSSFYPDNTLPQGFATGVTASIYQTPNNVADSVTYDGGHLTPHRDRNRTQKDATAVGILSNIIPQQSFNNQREWDRIERYVERLVGREGREVYVIAGTHEIKKDAEDKELKLPETSGVVNIPANLWKVILVLDPGQGVADITNENYAVGFYLENRQYTRSGRGEPVRLNNHLTTVNEIERLTGYDFFSNIPSNIQEQIENKRVRFNDRNIPIDVISV